MAKKRNARQPVNRLKTDWVDVNLSPLGTRLPTLDLADSAVTARIFRLRAIFIRAVDRTHAEFGLKPRMFLVLSALYRSGRPYTLPPAALTRYLMWSSGGLSQLLDRMTSAGLITRQSDPNDGRGVLVALTAKSQQMMVALYSAHSRTERRLISGLSKSDREALVSLLRKLLISIEGPQISRLDPKPRQRGMVSTHFDA